MRNAAHLGPESATPSASALRRAGGGVSFDGRRWIACRPGFFLPVRVLSRLFRRLFLEQLRAAFERKALKFFNAMAPLQEARAFEQFLAPATTTEWVVYAKAPFGGPEQVLQYLVAATRTGW